MIRERTLPRLTGAATPVRFPAIARDQLSSGMRVWSIPWTSVPIATVALVFEGGSHIDPAGKSGLASLTGDLTDEGAGTRDAVALAEAFDRLGTHLDVDVGQDVTILTFTSLTRNFDTVLALLADVVIRPHLAEPDFRRVRDLRLSRLRQMSSSAASAAERAFLAGVFGPHPYGQGTLGTSRGVQEIGLEDVRHLHPAMFRPDRATLIVAGDVSATAVNAAAREYFRDWSTGGAARADVPLPSAQPARCIVVDRPGAPQSELRIGHLGPGREPSSFPALTTLNAALGGQFTSRLNQLLRETKGYTYGARTGFDFRRHCSTFSCDTSVQSDATVDAIRVVLDEFRAVGAARPIDDTERARAQGSLTRGYVRHFETPAHLVRAAVELVRLDLPDDTFDRFVPDVLAVTTTNVHEAARTFVRADACQIVIVGDAANRQFDLSGFEREIIPYTPEF